MTLNISCPECFRSMTVPARMRGKKIRCKDCQAVIKVDAAESDEVAEQPPSRSLPQLNPKLPPKQTTESDSPAGSWRDEKRKNNRLLRDIPKKFRERVYKQLQQGEDIVWAGRKKFSWILFGSGAIATLLMGLLIIAGITAANVPYVEDLAAGRYQYEEGGGRTGIFEGGSQFLVGMAFVVLTIMGVGIGLQVWWHRSRNTFYVVTNRGRALVLEPDIVDEDPDSDWGTKGGPIDEDKFELKATSYSPKSYRSGVQIDKITIHRRWWGRGRISFGERKNYEEYKNWKNNGFRSLKDVDEVANLICKELKLPPATNGFRYDILVTAAILAWLVLLLILVSLL